MAVRAGGGICELLARRFQPVSGADVGENAMAKEEDDKRVGATNNASARAGVKTRAAARTKASGAMAESNEGEVAEAPKYDSAEVRDETLAKTNDVEAAEATEDVGTKTEQGVRTESKEDGVNIYDFQKLGTEQLASNTTAASSFLDTVQAIAAEATDYSREQLFFRCKTARR